MNTDILSTIANWVIAFANVTLFYIGYRTLRNDRKRIFLMEIADKKKFAENVFAWIEKRGEKSVEIVCRNGGSSVIYNVEIKTIDMNGNQQGDSYAIDLMKPFEEINFIVNHEKGVTITNTELCLVDPIGNKWIRDIHGILYQVSSDRSLINYDSSRLSIENNENGFPTDTKRRTLVKTIIWRVIGILWTFIGAYLIILFVPKEFSSALFIASLIAVYHHSTRMIMYYFYERIWLQIKWDRTTGKSIPMTLKEKIIWTIGFMIVIISILYFLVYISPRIEPK